MNAVASGPKHSTGVSGRFVSGVSMPIRRTRSSSPSIVTSIVSPSTTSSTTAFGGVTGSDAVLDDGLSSRVGAGAEHPDRDPSPQPPHGVCSTGATSATRLTRRNRGRQTDEFRTGPPSDQLTDRSSDTPTDPTIEPPEETR